MSRNAGTLHPITQQQVFHPAMTGPNQKTAPSFRPLYMQMKDMLIARLVSHDWPPGTLLPSEMALAKEYGVSQGTIRKALDAMAAERLVVRHQGRGTEVARHTSERALFQFWHIYGDDGDRRLPTSRVLDSGRGRADAEEAAALDIRRGEAVVRIARVRDLGGRPTLLERITVPAERFPGIEQHGVNLPNAIYEFYQREYNVTVHRADEELRAVAATREDAEHLNIAEGSPLLEIRRKAMDLGNRPVELRVSHCLTTHHHYVNKLV